jgi:Na+/melibiose symporter-like transporter
MCTDYQGRARLQSIRQIFNMAANLAGPALAWSIFFQDRDGIRGTTVAANYVRMGGVFSLATLLFVLLVVAGTFRGRNAAPRAPRNANGSEVSRFLRNMKQILGDANIRWVFIFVLVIGTGTLWMSALQVFVYDDFMRFSADEKSLAHSSTMVGWAIGAFFSVRLAKRFDKKSTVVVGGLVSFGANMLLALLFLTGIVSPGAVLRLGATAFPLGLGCFIAFHASYWLGIGIMMPIATAMIADLSEIQYLQTGCEKDGSYASVFSLANRLACSIGMITSGFGLHLIGYRVTPGVEAANQSPEAVWRLGFVSFVVGAGMCLIALLPILKYPVTRRCLESMRAAQPFAPNPIR